MNTGNTVRCEVSLASSVVVMVTPLRMALRCFRRHQRLAAQRAVLIDEGEADEVELVLLDGALDGRRGAVLRGRPEIVALDEGLR